MKNTTSETAAKYAFQIPVNKNAFANGARDGFPIGLGYLAAAFSLGIAARNAGLTPFQSTLASLLCNASAGEYAGFTLIAAGASLLEIAVVIFITNARYLLMSCAMSQRMATDMPGKHRMAMAFFITDELFAINMARPGYLNPYYSYGSAATSLTLWALGTALGTIAGNILPMRLVSAFSVTLYGMFLAVIIPPVRHDRIVGALVIISFIGSWLFSQLEIFSSISAGTKTILLTLLIAGGAALLFPREAEGGQEEDRDISHVEEAKSEETREDV
ncbi:MAG: AzlC family ABC transporter permease [Lachnospiraceae bacterium]|nr:AzlC family ABC transporter permease [Lachnospiraceae bacterium]